MFPYTDVDAILISNYTCMLALPFITETEVTQFFCHIQSYELLTAGFPRQGVRHGAEHPAGAHLHGGDAGVPRPHAAPLRGHQVEGGGVAAAAAAVRHQGRGEVAAALHQGAHGGQLVPGADGKLGILSTKIDWHPLIVQVGFNEKTSIFGLVEISPVSLGYCLGSCNWLITTGYEKVMFKYFIFDTELLVFDSFLGGVRVEQLHPDHPPQDHGPDQH